MDFSLSADQQSIRAAVWEVAARYDLEYWHQKDQQHAFASELWADLGGSGYLGVAIPEEYGGAGLGMLELALVCEEACRAGGGSTVSQLFMLTPVFGAMSILRHGTEDQPVSICRGLPRVGWTSAWRSPSPTLAPTRWRRKRLPAVTVKGISSMDRRSGPRV